MDKELIENIADALAASEICPFAHEDCIDNCHKHFSNWLDNHDKQIRKDAIDDAERELLSNGFIFTEHALEVWHSIAEQLKEQKNEEI